MKFELDGYQIELNVKQIGRQRATKRAAIEVLTRLYWLTYYAEEAFRVITDETWQEMADRAHETRAGLNEIIRRAQNE